MHSTGDARSGQSLRTCGHAPSAAAVLTVILVAADADPTEVPDADWWGSNAWHAHEHDRRMYGEADK